MANSLDTNNLSHQSSQANPPANGAEPTPQSGSSTNPNLIDQKYRTLFQAIDQGFHISELIYDPAGQVIDWRFLEVNPAFERLTGLQSIEGQLGSQAAPGTESYWLEAYQQVVQTGEPMRLENYNQMTRRWYSAYAARIGPPGSHQFVVVFDDITHRKQRETNLAFLAEVSQDLARLTTIDETMKTLGAKIGAHFQVANVAFGEVDEPNEVMTVAHEWRGTDALSFVGHYRISDFLDDDLRHTMRAGKVWVMSDVMNDARANAEPIAALGIGAMASVPFARQGEWLFNLTLYDRQARHWREDEIDLLRETATFIWTRLERARAEQALRQSEAQFRLLILVSSDSIYRMSADWTQMYQLTGKSFLVDTADSSASWLQTYIPLEDQGHVQQVIKGAIQTKTPFELEHRVLRADGTVGWTASRAIPVLDEQGQLQEWLGAASDITPRKQAEQDLRDSEARLQLALGAAELGTFIWYLTEDRTEADARSLAHFGLPPDTQATLADSLANIFHPDDGPRYVAAIAQATDPAGSGTMHEEFRIRRSDGERWMSVMATSVFEGSPPVATRITGVLADITERKQAAAALYRSEARLRAILESAQDYAIFTTDLDQHVTSWNRGAQTLFGYSEPAILHQSVAVLYNPQDRQQGVPRLEAQTAIRVGHFDNERWHSRQDGSLFYGSGVVTPLHDESGSLIGLLKVMRDLTTQKRAEEALTEADRRKDEFLAMLAHELRNPMSTIRSGLQILALSMSDDAVRSPTVAASTVAMMNRQTDQLVRLVDELLDVSRISQGKIDLHTERVNLVEVVGQAAESVRALYQEQGKHLQVDLAKEPIYLAGDTTRLTQIVINLLTNGARYTPSNGQVWLRLSHQTGMPDHAGPTLGTPGRQEAILQVQDNGIGLAADQLEAIFELFVQVDNSLARSQGGLGLGLTLVKRLVELHGGRVEAQSEGLGQGSTFTVYLPTLAAEIEEVPKADPLVSDSSPSRRILVVDDNADAGLTLAMLLKLKGYEAHTRTSGRAGIEAAQALQPSAILLDIGMPDLDGYATSRLIREQVWGRDVVIIALTGYGQDEDRQRTRAAGFDGHLVKPVDLVLLTNLLTDLQGKDAAKAKSN